MCMGGGGSDAASLARQQQQRTDARIQTGMNSINNAFSGFTPGFYNQRAQDYVNYALPQLNQQSKQQGANLAYGLSGQGLTRSSAGQNLWGQLNNQIDQNKTGLVNAGQQQAQQLQQTVGQQKTNLVGQLQASADPAAAGQQALSTASTFSAPSAFAPVGNLFQNWSNIYTANSLANTPGYQASSPFGFGSSFNRPVTGYSAPTTIFGGR